MVRRGPLRVSRDSAMAMLRRLPSRIQAATLRVHPNLVLCWIAGAFLSIEVLGRGFGAI
jgi:hypothetical protein